MSTPSTTVVASDGKHAATAMPMTGGGVALSPLPLTGGRRSRKMTKKMRKMLKTLKKLKGGLVDDVVEGVEQPPVPVDEGGRRRRRGSRRSRRGSRKGRAGLFY